MKKYYSILFVFLFFIRFGYGQGFENNSSKELIIYSNNTKNTNIFFDSNIKSGIVGNQNFTFGYSNNSNSKIGILKATPGAESNLLVITENGNIYSFIVRYKSEITVLNYFIKDLMAIGNENGEIVHSTKVNITEGKKNEELIPVVSSPSNGESNVVNEITVNDFETRTSDSVYKTNYERVSQFEIKKPMYYNRIYGTKNKVFVKLKNIVYDNNELYFSLILKNESTLDYDINYLNFYIISRNKSRNTVSQTIPYEPVYVEQPPSRINANSEIEVVYVYKKFTINENKVLLIEMSEDNGERLIKLEIPNSFINNPNKI